MSLQTPVKIRTFQRKLYLKAKAQWHQVHSRGTHNMIHAVCFRVKPVGKADAVAPHVRFDERGWETGLYVTAPILDSTGA